MRVATVATRVVPASADQDRVAHRSQDGVDIVVLADGVGGIAGGREAAERVVTHDFQTLEGPADCIRELALLDRELCEDKTCGETTACLLVVRNNTAFGASVGDSGVWALTTDAIFDLTRDQRRKPLLGSGAAEPVGFGPSYFNDRLLVASDGLFKYAPRDVIRRITFTRDIDAAADQLVAAARLPGGGLHDDVALALLDPFARSA